MDSLHHFEPHKPSRHFARTKVEVVPTGEVCGHTQCGLGHVVGWCPSRVLGGQERLRYEQIIHPSTDQPPHPPIYRLHTCSKTDYAPNDPKPPSVHHAARVSRHRNFLLSASSAGSRMAGGECLDAVRRANWVFLGYNSSLFRLPFAVVSLNYGKGAPPTAVLCAIALATAQSPDARIVLCERDSPPSRGVSIDVTSRGW